MGFEFPGVGAAASVAVATTAVILLGPVSAVSAADVQGPNIAVLMSHDAPPYQAALKGFQEQLAQSGVQARYEVYMLRGDPAEPARAMQHIARNEPRLVYTLGAFATEAVIDAGIDVPLTACLLLNSEDIRKAPHGAGVGLEIPVDVQFQWLQRVLPHAKRVGVLFNPNENQDKVDAASRAARAMGLTLFAYPIDAPRDIPEALNRMAKEVDVLWGLPDHTAISPETAKALLLFSLRNRIPFIGLSASWAKAGALYALDRDYADLGRQCGELARDILDGRPPESLPPASPRKVVYAINLRTALHMKVTIPEALIRGASGVFE